jgi:hypothetical protein
MCELLLFFSLLLFSLAHFLFFFYVITDIDEQKRFVKTYLSASVTWEFTVLEPNKKAHLTPCISPKFYSWTGRGGGLPTWYWSQEVLNSSPGHAYSTRHNYSRLQKSIRWS